MKYLIVGGFGLLITILVSRVFIALDLINLNAFSTSTVEELRVVDETTEKKYKKIGEHTYQIFCSSCHGMNGKGNDGKAQNHTKRIAEKSVLDVIKNGSNNFKSVYPAGMPAGLISDEEAKEVAKYVANGLNGKKPNSWSVCTSCHDESGEGISFVAPNIKAYSNELVATVLKNGKKGVIGTMPVFGDRLTDIQMKALATYIRSIQK